MLQYLRIGCGSQAASLGGGGDGFKGAIFGDIVLGFACLKRVLTKDDDDGPDLCKL